MVSDTRNKYIDHIWFHIKQNEMKTKKLSRDIVCCLFVVHMRFM